MSENVFETIRSLAAYINFFSAYFLAKVLTEREIISSVRLNRFIFLSLITLGLLQIFNLIPWVNSFLEFLVPRASSGALIEENRGVTLISSEPARAGVELIFISPIFKTPKSKKFLNPIKFNFLALKTKKKVIALGGINSTNLKRLNMIKAYGFAGISYFENNDIIKT